MSFHQPLILEDGEVRQLIKSIVEKIVDGSNLVWLINDDTTDTDIGTPMYVDSSNNLKKAKADSISTAKVYCLATEAVFAGQLGIFQTVGLLQTTLGLPGGTILFLSATTAGELTDTPPTTAGHFIVRIGTTGVSDRLSINIQPPLKRA